MELHSVCSLLSKIKSMTQLPKHQLYAVAMVVIPLFMLFLIHEQGDIVLAVNGLHHPLLDIFFIYLTQLGDGIVFLFLAVLLVTVKFRYTIITALVGGVHALLIGVMKKGFFSHVPRPRNFFDAEAGLHFINNVNVHGWMSFPSGHTASAFALALLVSFMAKNKMVTVLCMCYALLIGVSRIYLLQHFYIDVFSGVVIGFLSTLLVWWGLNYITLPSWADQKLVFKISLHLQPGAKKAPAPKPSF